MRIAAFSVFAGLCLISSVATADLPRIFMTSAQGTGDLSSWPDAHGLTGLRAADEICRTAAGRAGLDGAAEYIAYLSGDNDDLYCRVHSLAGKRSAKCGQPWLPLGGGPWFRMDGLGALDRVEWAFPAVPAAGYMPRPVVFFETGAAVPLPPAEGSLAFTSTRDDGSLSHFAPTCGNWSSADSSLYSDLTSGYHTFADISPHGWTCDRQAHLICLQRGPHGAALPRRRPSNARMAFISSAKGNAYFASWPASGGLAGIAGADQVCRQLAASAQLPLPDSYKALLTTSDGLGALERFVHDGPWYRTDGVLLAASKAALRSELLSAPLQIDELQRPTKGFEHRVWTGSTANLAPVAYNCSDWTQVPNGETFAQVGQNWTTGKYWSGEFGGLMCNGNTTAAVYCLADNDSLFTSGME